MSRRWFSMNRFSFSSLVPTLGSRLPDQKWLCVGSEPHHILLAKGEGHKSPVLLHTFTTVQGNRREIGLGKVQTVVLSSLTRNAQAELVETSDIFTSTNTKSFSLTYIFQVGSEEGLKILTNKTKTKSNPKLKFHPCVLLPYRITLSLLEVEKAATAEIFLVAKEAITSRLLSMTHKD